MLHFLGGVCVAMAFLSFYYYIFKFTTTNKLKVIGIVFISVVTVGVLWEIFELVAGQTFLTDGVVYIRDTASDLLMDVCGGFFGTLYSYGILPKENING